MNPVTIRVDMRITEEMNKYLLDEAHAKKLSFEGLLIAYIEERMAREKNASQRSAR